LGFGSSRTEKGALAAEALQQALAQRADSRKHCGPAVCRRLVRLNFFPGFHVKHPHGLQAWGIGIAPDLNLAAVEKEPSLGIFNSQMLQY
jgi:hypothetical protein